MDKTGRDNEQGIFRVDLDLVFIIFRPSNFLDIPYARAPAKSKVKQNTKLTVRMHFQISFIETSAAKVQHQDFCSLRKSRLKLRIGSAVRVQDSVQMASLIDARCMRTRIPNRRILSPPAQCCPLGKDLSTLNQLWGRQGLRPPWTSGSCCCSGECPNSCLRYSFSFCCRSAKK